MHCYTIGQHPIWSSPIKQHLDQKENQQLIYNWHLAGEENMLKECNKDKEQESFMKLRIQAKIAKNKIKKKEKECKVAEKKGIIKSVLS